MNNAALLFVSKVVQKFCLKTELQLTPGTLTAFNFWYIFFYLQILVLNTVGGKIIVIITTYHF